MPGIVLSPRLQAAASFIKKGARVADIGTDHARLPIWLIQNKVCKQVIAGDLNPGPLKRAERLVRLCGVQDQVRLVCCDGLSGMDSGQVDTIVIAGLGGDKIAEILSRCAWAAEQGRRLILQPASSADSLRSYLLSGGCQILAERLTQDAGRIYQTMLASAGRMSFSHPAQLYAGLFLNSDPLYAKHLDGLIRRFEKACGALENPDWAVSEKQAYFKDILNWLRDERVKAL